MHWFEQGEICVACFHERSHLLRQSSSLKAHEQPTSRARSRDVGSFSVLRASRHPEVGEPEVPIWEACPDDTLQTRYCPVAERMGEIAEPADECGRSRSWRSSHRARRQCLEDMASGPVCEARSLPRFECPRVTRLPSGDDSAPPLRGEID